MGKEGASQDASKAPTPPPPPAPPAKPEPLPEVETDAPACKKEKHKEPVKFLTPDTTLNVMQSATSNLLTPLSDGGIRHFLAGARCNTGISKGRYMFEVETLQQLTNVEDGRSHPLQLPRAELRLGVSLADSELILGESADSICFDSEGYSMTNKVRTFGTVKFTKTDIVTLVVNLEKDSSNFNTISLFKDGVRATAPLKLPEHMQGKPVFPHVTFKGVSIHVNFGPNVMTALPFTCRAVQDATKTDVTVTKAKEPAGGKYDLLVPVSLPDEGTFDWLDLFLEKNRQYMELSDRKFLDWAEKSGLTARNVQSTKDKPSPSFRCRELDDGSVRKALMLMAAVQPRHYVVMEVRGNLLKDDRKETLSQFKAPLFKRVGLVMVGDPPSDFKAKSQQLMLADKQAASDKAHEVKVLEAKRTRADEKRKKDLDRKRKNMEKELKKKAKAIAAEARAKVKARAEAAEAEKKAKEEAAKKEADEAAKKAEGEKKEGNEAEKKEGEEGDKKEGAKTEKKEGEKAEKKEDQEVEKKADEMEVEEEESEPMRSRY